MTDEIDTQTVFNQFPDDINYNYMKQKEQKSGKKTKKKMETIRLNKFVAQATPLVELLLDENAQAHYNFNK